MTTIDKAALAKRLYDRRAEAEETERVQIAGGDWQPSRNDCHRNAGFWCLHHPEHTVVHGWVVAGYLLDVPDAAFYQFFAHSVVETEGGELLDLTPNSLGWTYPFLRHGDDAEFRDIVEGHGITAVVHPVK